MKRILLAWIGNNDLKASKTEAADGVGPIAQVVTTLELDEVHLLGNYPQDQCLAYIAWLRRRTSVSVVLRTVSLPDPTDFEGIHNAAVAACEAVLAGRRGQVQLYFHLSPGTPAMAAIWMILGKTRFPAELLQSSQQHGVRTAHIPLEISAEFVPSGLSAAFRDGAAAEPPVAAGFESIFYRSPEMKRVVDLARQVAGFDVSVLIEGESGTGKELFARAIHKASRRAKAEFLAVNCGAIPADLVESELFGHRKGAFTGATEDRAGYFESANGGTLFLDEIGELPPRAQVKLLRVLQEGEIVKVGDPTPRAVNVRIIAATNRSLATEISESRFREDLFYRLAVAVLVLPPLRERTGDAGLLLDRLFEQVNQKYAGYADYQPKSMSPGARQVFLSHVWPGNVRELLNTIHRAVILSRGNIIEKNDASAALLPRLGTQSGNPWDRPVGGDFSLPNLIGEVAREYLQRALAKSGGNKTKAAQLIGLPSQQTFSNWLEKYGG